MRIPTSLYILYQIFVLLTGYSRAPPSPRFVSPHSHSPLFTYTRWSTIPCPSTSVPLHWCPSPLARPPPLSSVQPFSPSPANYEYTPSYLFSAVFLADIYLVLFPTAPNDVPNPMPARVGCPAPALSPLLFLLRLRPPRLVWLCHTGTTGKSPRICINLYLPVLYAPERAATDAQIYGGRWV